MPDEQGGAPEANQSSAAEMVELIRLARTIVETGWPMPAEGNHETGMYDALQRANLVAGVFGMMIEEKRAALPPTADWEEMMDRFSELSTETLRLQETVSENITLQRAIIQEMGKQAEAMGEVSRLARAVFETLKAAMEKLGQ